MNFKFFKNKCFHVERAFMFCEGKEQRKIDKLLMLIEIAMCVCVRYRKLDVLVYKT